jgi:alkanesulfonate monooxygenase SsuD/methylene tetrahydromethanopterin reductase-like flavin-dependent oxidoreductase (luciferase family)
VSLALGIASGGGDSAREFGRLRRLAVQADGLGLHSIWLPEGHFRAGAVPSPLVALAALAGATRTIRLATTSLLLSIHHPLRVAADVATLDRISGGRVLLGLGRGFQPALFRAFGVSAATKRDRFGEALDVLLRAFAGDSLGGAGDFFPGLGVGGSGPGLRPAQKPHPPLVVAAFGPKGLRQAARRGLPYLASPLETLDTLAENRAIWSEHLRGELDPRAPRVPVMRTVFVAADERAARRVREGLEVDSLHARARVGHTTPALERAASGRSEDRLVVGTRGRVADELGRYRERLGMDLLVARTEVPRASEAERDGSLETLAALAAES